MARLYFITGKGGVGKSLITTSLALKAARCRQRVAVIELNNSRLVALLPKSTPPIHHFSLDHMAAFEEFMLTKIHSKALYHTLCDNKFVHNFIDATPGLKELLLLGKLLHLCEESSFDSVFLDAPASGHGFALLEVPFILNRFLHQGPLRTSSDHLISFLMDRQKFHLVFVTRPEEMPVDETIEFYHAFKDKLHIPPSHLIVNGLHPAPSTSQSAKMPKSNQQALALTDRITTYYAQSQKRAFHKLAAITLPPISLPLHSDPFSARLAKDISEELPCLW